jgi:iron complex outermembrane receptor protein
MPTSLNLAAYHQWIVNSQRTAYTFSAADGPAAVTVNVPQGRAYGLELDGTIRPSSWLTLGGNFNYIHSRFLPLPVAANGQLQVFDQVPDTPRYTGSAYADITVPVSDHLQVMLHGDVYAQSKAFTFPRSTNNQGTTIDGYAIANFRVGVGSSEGAWTLTANVKNAFNQVYYVGGLPTGELYQINLLIPGEPRTFTVEARFKF